jgi:3-hydroxymyristoyl/3-hydroxydecanoyl-(acyl carrier protein) dehydratase
MQLLDAVLYMTDTHAVGYLDVKEDMFWIRGHFPDRPLMPGVLICESAAQLSSYFAIKTGLVSNGVVGLGGLESIRFRNPVVPGDRLTLMLQKGRARPNAMFKADFQGFVNETLVVDGTIKGVALS